MDINKTWEQEKDLMQEDFDNISWSDDEAPPKAKATTKTEKVVALLEKGKVAAWSLEKEIITQTDIYSNDTISD